MFQFFLKKIAVFIILRVVIPYLLQLRIRLKKKDAEKKAEREAKEKAEREAKEKAEREAKEKAEPNV